MKFIIDDSHDEELPVKIYVKQYGDKIHVRAKQGIHDACIMSIHPDGKLRLFNCRSRCLDAIGFKNKDIEIFDDPPIY